MKFLILPLFFFFSTSHASKQTYTVGGGLFCNGKPMIGHEIQLWDDDMLGPDDKLGSIHTDTTGHFAISGYENEVGHVSAYLRVLHTCNYVGNYKQESIFWIPREYLDKVYHINMELSTNQGRVCRHC